MKLNVLITGTNRGIGSHLVKIFYQTNPQSIIYATSREQPNLAQKKWKELDTSHRIICKQLQLASQQSIKQFTESISKEGIKFDILINNAALGSKSDDYSQLPSLQQAKDIMATNLIGTIKFTNQMLPNLTDNARIIHVSSLLGALSFHPAHTIKKYSDPNITLEDIEKGANQYIKDVQNSDKSNWYPSAYGTGKMLLNCWSRFILTKQLKQTQKSICVTPGHCQTDMGGAKAFHTAESGAKKIYETIWLKNLNSQIFYHRARESNFEICGNGLPVSHDQ